MRRAVVHDRVRSDVEVLARAGLDVATFLAEVDVSIRRAVPNDAMCVSVLDPATSLPTATFKFGEIAEQESHDLHWCQVEFGRTDETSFRSMSERRTTSIGVHLATDGNVLESVRMREFMDHHFGFTDELRAIAGIDGREWGAVAMLRGDQAHPFDPDAVALMSSLSGALAGGLRGGLMARPVEEPEIDSAGPAVIIMRGANTIVQVNSEAEHWLEALSECDNSGGPFHTLAALVHAAHRHATGESDVPARSRIRLPSGTWLVLHCTPLTGSASTGEDVVVTIEEARPPEVLPLVVAAFELTPRERDVTELVLQGVPSKEIATQLSISVYTVQDHLRSVFEKAGVRSRRDLMARVFFDQYRPRIRGAPVGGPSD